MRSNVIPTTAFWSATRASRFLPACRLGRQYSIKAKAASTSRQRPLEPYRLSIIKTTSPKPLSKPQDLVFGKEFTGEPLQSPFHFPVTVANYSYRSYAHH